MLDSNESLSYGRGVERADEAEPTAQPPEATQLQPVSSNGVGVSPPAGPAPLAERNLGLTGLTAKQEKFAVLYARTGQAREAYLAAYPGGHLAPTSLAAQANRTLNHPKIKARIEELRLRSCAASDVTVDRVVREYAKLAFSDVDPDDVKPADKRAALDSLAKWLGMFAEKQSSQTGTITWEAWLQLKQTIIQPLQQVEGQK